MNFFIKPNFLRSYNICIFYWIQILFIVTVLIGTLSYIQWRSSIWKNINGEWGPGEYYRERTYRLKYTCDPKLFLKKVVSEIISVSKIFNIKKI
jgi:hypothetical protein